jgi:septum formation protein
MALLQQIGVKFSVRPADIDETPVICESAAHYVERMAREKALKVALANSQSLVLGADTSVVLDGKILGKPVGHDDAFAMLRQLSGASHQVLTAVALASGADCQVKLVMTDVVFRGLSDREISAYIATGEPADKAGSYGIQGLGGTFVRELRGSYSAVVGLPLQETAALLADAGSPVWENWSGRQESQT